MAYMSQERKEQIRQKLAPVLAKYQLNASLSVRHHSTIVLTIYSGAVDFITNYNETMKSINGIQRGESNGYIDVNTSWYKEHFSAEPLEAITEIMEALNFGNHDRSDIQSDYFDVGWYTDVHIGSYKHNYLLREKREAGTNNETTAVSDITVRKNEEKGGIEILFPNKPDQSIIDALKNNGYRWSKFSKLWWTRFSEDSWNFANNLVGAK